MDIVPEKRMPDLYHIHGDFDAIILYPNVEKYQPFYPGEYVLEKVVDGGHCITLTHAEQVNAFIEKYIFSEEEIKNVVDNYPNSTD
jgi:pimeloyl-ACP methyl ester carboxylesterase